MKPTVDDHQCTACQKRLHIRGAWTVGERSGTLLKLIDDYKFESRRAAAEVIGELLGTTLPALPSDTVITWVPTVRAHIRERGFDHAAHIAAHLARKRGWRAQRLLARHHSLTQHELTRAGRLKAAQDAFSLAGAAVEGPVLLVDDVLTTGATLRACVALLRDAGADVYVAVVSRQMPN